MLGKEWITCGRVEFRLSGRGARGIPLRTNVERKTAVQLEKDLAMSPRTSRKFFGSDDVPRLPLRKRPGNWLTPPASAVSCAGTSSSIQVPLAGSALLVKDDRGAGTEPVRKKRKCARLVVGVDAEEQQDTRDLCASFLNMESAEFGGVVPWRSTSNSPNGMDLQQSGTTSEEDLTTRDAIDNDSADTVRSAAELLTQLICERNAGSSNGQLQGLGGPHSHDPQRQALEKPIRWGVKKKVSYESRRSVDSCDLGICTGLIRKPSHDQEKPAARTPDPNTFHSPVASWDPSSPNFPASLDLHKDRRSSGDGGASSSFRSPGLSFQGSRSERQKKLLPMTPPCPGNILKLPKEMQGRWSCERYKVAQLKLIEIMHERKTAPGRPILRPALREEARKHIGDTGLLDHLLKHMTDTVVNTGERFRRRHNSEGAMEYWLEHASLMELRKAAGVEDPSWIPPAGWKVGDKLPDRNWQLNRGMTSAEAAEMKKLKETVERLKSEMKVLCGSITASNQRGALPSLSISYDDRLGVPERAEEEGNPIQGRIRVDMIQSGSDMRSIEQPSHQELKSGANMGITMERSQNLESAVPKTHEDRKPLKEIGSPSGNQDDLESQLQDVRRTVAMMQADASHVINVLGIVPPIKAKPMRYPLDPGNALPLVLSAGDETGSITQRSPESQPSDTSKPVIHDFVIPKQDAPMRQCSNSSRSSNGGNWVGNSAPYTDGLSQALSNYNLVNQPDPLSAHSNEKKKYSECTMKTHDSGPPVTVLSRAQNFKPTFTSQPTGFTICRPPGSFLWPSMLNVTQVLPTNNPSMSRREQTVDLRVLEGGTGNVSFGIPTSSPMAPVNHSIRSIAESKVAATMATMFGCMAMAPPVSLPTLPLMTSEADTARNNLGQCSVLGAEQSNPALSLSLSLSVSPHGISSAVHKQKSL